MNEIDILKVFTDFFYPKKISVFWDRTYQDKTNVKEYITLEFEGTQGNIYGDDETLTTTTTIVLRYFYNQDFTTKKDYGYKYISKIKKEITNLIIQNNFNLILGGFDIGAVNNYNCIGFEFTYDNLN